MERVFVAASRNTSTDSISLRAKSVQPLTANVSARNMPSSGGGLLLQERKSAAIAVQSGPIFVTADVGWPIRHNRAAKAPKAMSFEEFSLLRPSCSAANAGPA